MNSRHHIASPLTYKGRDASMMVRNSNRYRGIGGCRPGHAQA